MMDVMQSKLRVSQPHVSVSAETTQQAVNLFHSHGALWLENVFSKSTIEELRIAYEKKYLNLSKKELRKRDAAVGDQRFMITVDVKGAFNQPELFANEAISPILHGLLSDTMRIASFGSVVALPDADDQAIHLDHPPLFGVDDDRLPVYALTMVVPLIDLTPETGSTAIWEGSHKKSGSRNQLVDLMNDPTWDGSVHPLPKLGDVYLMDYRVIHGGMANNCDQPRPILYLVYGRPWFQDAYNFSDQPPVKFAKGEFKKVPVTHRSLFAGHAL